MPLTVLEETVRYKAGIRTEAQGKDPQEHDL